MSALERFLASVKLPNLRPLFYLTKSDSVVVVDGCTFTVSGKRYAVCQIEIPDSTGNPVTRKFLARSERITEINDLKFD